MQKYIEQKIDDLTYTKTRSALLSRQVQITENLKNLRVDFDKRAKDLSEIGKLLKDPVFAYKNADLINRRRLIKSMTGKLFLNNKQLDITWLKTFEMVANRSNLKFGGKLLTILKLCTSDNVGMAGLKPLFSRF